jgi:hypothetical protein
MDEKKQSVGGGNETIHPRTLDQVPNVATYGPPAVAFYKGKIYLAYAPKGDQFLGQIWCTTFDGTNWSNPFQLLFPSNTFSPALEVYAPDTLYCAANNGNQAWYMTFDGTIWSTAQAIPNSPQISTNPALGANSDMLYVAYQTDQSGDVSYQTFDGTNWSQPSPIPVASAIQGSSGVVGLAAAPNGKIYLAYQKVDSMSNPTGQLWYTVFDGTNWSTPAQIPNVSLEGEPALGYSHLTETLCCLHRGTGSEAHHLWYTLFDGTKWSGDTHFTTPDLTQSPAIASVYTDFANRARGLYFFITTTEQNIMYFYYG